MEMKLTLWEKKGKNKEGKEFTSFSNKADIAGEPVWVNAYRRTANTKDGEVEVIDLVVKPREPMDSKKWPPEDKTPLSSIPF